MGTVVLATRLLLAGVFAVAGVAKLLDRRGTREALEGFGVSSVAVPAGALLLPLAELATAILLVPRPSAQVGGVAALILLLGFILGIVNAMARGEAPDCHCFGQLHPEPAGRSTLARNIGLAALALLVTVEGPGPSITSWIADRTDAELIAVGAGILVAALGVIALRLWQSNRGLRRALGEAWTQLAAFPPGLPVGAAAPDFSLRSLDGATVSLRGLLARGRPVALVFVSPDCGPCEPLFPELVRWQATLADQLTIAVVSIGTSEQNLAVARDANAHVLLQRDAEVMRAYRVGGTPATVIITPEGRVASEPIPGAVLIETQIRLTLRQHARQATTAGRLIPTPAG